MTTMMLYINSQHVEMLDLDFNCTNVILIFFATTLFFVGTTFELWKSLIFGHVTFKKHPMTS